MHENNEITSTHDIAEGDWDGYSEPADVESDLVATEKPEGKGIEFHISMRDYTMADMEDLIVQAAATKLLDGFGDKKLSKLIEDRAIDLISARADDALRSVSTEIIDQPLTPDFGSKQPVTMREFIGLTGREYLSQKVGSNGKPCSYNARPRIEWIVEGWLDRGFKSEIEKETRTTIVEVRKAVKAEHEKLLSSEKARIFEAVKHASDIKE